MLLFHALHATGYNDVTKTCMSKRKTRRPNAHETKIVARIRADERCCAREVEIMNEYQVRLKAEPLAEIIKKATVNATYVIPDLQRPFVWTE